MANTRQNRFNGWSELNHDVLLLILMRVGAVDFFAFSGVCKSWRLLTLLNKNKFMESILPMLLRIHPRHSRVFPFRKHRCYLKDPVDGRMTKITLPHSAGRKLVGLTCGYFVLYGRRARDFWLLNPITRHGLHFPRFPCCLDDTLGKNKVILVFSPSMSGWVLVVAPRHGYNIWFSIVGKGAWNHCIFDDKVIDVHAFKGKIYTITLSGHAYEVRLNPQPKVVILKTENLEKLDLWSSEIVSSGEKLYVMYNHERVTYLVELDTCEMKWVWPRKNLQKLGLSGSEIVELGLWGSEIVSSGENFYVIYNHEGVSYLKHAAVNAWVESWKVSIHYANEGWFRKMFYFPHDCLRVDILHDS